MDKINRRELKTLSQQWNQYKIRGKFYDRIRIGKDGILTECPICQEKTGHLHIVGCSMEASPCGFCLALCNYQCECEYHLEENE